MTSTRGSLPTSRKSPFGACAIGVAFSAPLPPDRLRVGGRSFGLLVTMAQFVALPKSAYQRDTTHYIPS